MRRRSRFGVGRNHGDLSKHVDYLLHRPNKVATRKLLSAQNVAEATTGRTHHLTRVAANVLATVERELALGPEQAASQHWRLQKLGQPDEATLAEAIRAGDLDDRLDEVRSILWEMVLDKLAVANPAYPEAAHRRPAPGH